MSDQAPQPPKPTAKTSTVPLKKETVRITLRAKPQGGAAKPSEDTTVTPSAPKPPVSAPSPAPATPPPAAAPSPAPASPPPAAPPAAAPSPAPAAPPAAGPPSTGMMARTGAPELAKTQKVTVKAAPSVGPGAPGAGGVTPASKTVPLGGGPVAAAPATKALPKATVKLQQPTQSLAAPPSGQLGAGPASGPLGMQDGMGIQDDGESNVLPFSIAAAILGIAALVVAMMASDVVGLQLPPSKNPTWEKKTDAGYASTFSSSLPEVPVYSN
jgi:hypothetical protein